MKEIEITTKLGRDLNPDEVQSAAIKALGMSPKAKTRVSYRILRRSIDARNDVLYRYKLEVYRPEEVMPEYVLDEYQDVSGAEPIIIIGAGPAGMFAALKLLMKGFKPVILERGKDVHKRKVDMARLSTAGGAAIEAADIVIMTDEPSKIATAMKIARRTLSICRQNIVFAIGIKVLVLVLTAFGYTNMWAAVFADVGVAVLAILNAMRALKKV